jgi:hypothetical protein
MPSSLTPRWARSLIVGQAAGRISAARAQARRVAYLIVSQLAWMSAATSSAGLPPA